MKCPACNGELLRTSLEGETVDVCTACEGAWFDQHELGRVVARLRADEAPATRDVSPPSANSARMCPRCGVEMTERAYAYDSNVPLDHCPACKGTWVDPGELERIAKYRAGTPAVRALGEAMIVRSRAEARWRRVRSLLRSRPLSVAAAVICVLLWLANGRWPVGPLRLNFIGRPVWLIRFVVALGMALACIWLADVVMHMRKRHFGIYLSAPSEMPGDAVAIAGWVLMGLAFALATVL